MRGRYNGCIMSVYGSIIPGAARLASIPVTLSKRARQRLKWFDYYYSHDQNASLTCRYFGISRQTFYRWKRRYHPKHLEGLEDRSSRPKHVRQVQTPKELVEAILRLREEHPRWGKDKLAVLLRNRGLRVSTSTVGRTIARLKARGVLREPRIVPVSAGKRRKKRPYGVRKPRDYKAKEPGDLVEVDTLDVRPLPGVVFKHFTAHDVVSRWDVLEARTRATARTAAEFLEAMLERMPFVVKAIQVDGGSEFFAQFEAECQRRGIQLFELPPRSPELNGAVERAHRTHTEEFYEITDFALEVEELNRELRNWERVYNEIRPHQALGYLTPKQFLEHWRQKQKDERAGSRPAMSSSTVNPPAIIPQSQRKEVVSLRY